MNFLSFTWMHYEFTIFFVNLLWIYSFFREFIMLSFSVYRGFSRNSLSWVLLLMYSDFTWRRIWREEKGNKLPYLSTLSLYIKNRTKCYANSLCIHLRFRESVGYFEKIPKINYLFNNKFTDCFMNPLCIYYLYREFTMNLLSISRSYQEFTLFREFIMNSLFYFANWLFLANCMHSFYIFYPDLMSFSTL